MLCIVPDDNLGNSKSIDDVLPYKFVGVLFGDFGERLDLYPLGEIGDGNDQELPNIEELEVEVRVYQSPIE